MNKFYALLRRIPLSRGPQRVLGGICGGIAGKFGWNAAVVRVVTVLLFLLPGIGIFTYVVVWLLLPRWDGSIVLERLISAGGSGAQHS